MTLAELLEKKQFKEYSEIGVNQIIIDPQVRKLCEANTCGSYGRNHMCPPHVDDLDFWKSKIMGFGSATIVTKVYELEDSYDVAAMFEGAIDFENSLRDVKVELEADQPDREILVLGAGQCNYCERCSCLDDLPCIHPDMAYPSVEACGIDVSSLSKKAGVKYNNGTNTITYFGMILM